MAATFSYAQAARGASSAPPSAPVSSKPSSGAMTPAKESNPPTAPASSAPNWADDGEQNATMESTNVARETRKQVPPPTKDSNAPQHAPVSVTSSPDLGASSTSTVAKDDDVVSMANNSSETTTWENKSQASTSVDKTVEPAEKTSDKVKKGKDLKREALKPLQDAPLPTVNIWQQRADQIKSKVASKPAAAAAAAAKPTSTAAAQPLPNGVPQGPTGTGVKKGKREDAGSKEKETNGDAKPRAREDENVAQVKKEVKTENEPDKSKKGFKARSLEKPTVLPLPPDRDQDSWPTPETAVHEDLKKAQEKGDKERKDNSSSGSHGKQEWVKVPYTPNVIFNTPLPNAAGSRRGGRGGGRGGAHSGGRGGGFAANGTAPVDKEVATSGPVANGDQPKRGRADGSSIRDTSPKMKRPVSGGSPSAKDKPATYTGEKSSRAAATSDAETSSRRASVVTEPQPHNHTFPRNYPSGRPPKGGRKGDAIGAGRRDGDASSPIKDNNIRHDRHISTTAQTDVEEHDRRAPNFHDGQHGSSGRQGRGFNSYGRDRARGGGRGGRNNYQNGHQFSNGHGSQMQFPLRSPTSFNPDPNAYFGTNQNKYRNGMRSQSVNADLYRMPGYPGGPPVPPMQPYMGYDFPVMPHMGAVPFNNFEVPPSGPDLVSNITSQLEYYFSTENLIKDTFMRKHMDSQGFVPMSFIAGFNRVKAQTTDTDLLKHVCHQASVIEYRVTSDGKDVLRRAGDWQRWVLPMPQRDPSAQNDGPDELHHPHIPHPAGYDQSNMHQYPEVHPGSPHGPVPFGHEGAYINGFVPGAPQHLPAVPPENMTNGAGVEGANGSAVPNGHAVENATKTVSGDPDSFSDEQVESLTVIVRKQDQSQTPAPSVARTFSNGSIDSKSGVPDEASLKVNGTGPPQGRTSTPPIRLYWVKDKVTPVDSIPLDSTHESYHVLRSKAFQQRQFSPLGHCPYDMDVLYQFWSHFLIRNFNTRMYNEFRQFALEDATRRMNAVGLMNLTKFYGESLLSSHLLRESVAQHFVDLVQSDFGDGQISEQLRAALRNHNLDPRNRRRINGLMGAECQVFPS